MVTKNFSTFRFIALVLLAFGFIYEVQPKGVPDFLTSRKLVFFISAIYSFRNRKQVLPMRSYDLYSSTCKKLFILAILMLIWTFLLGSLNGNLGNSQSILSRTILFIPFVPFVYWYLRDMFKSVNEFCNAVFFASLLQAIIVICDYFMDSVKIFLFNTFVLDANNTYLATERAMGVGAGESLLSINLFLGLVATACIILKTSKYKIFYIVGYVTILFACLLSGSTGFVSGLALLLYIVGYQVVQERSFSSIFTVVLFIIAVITLFSVASSFFSEIDDFEIYRKISEFWTGDIKDTSIVSSLEAQEKAPISMETIIGTGIFRGRANGVYQRSDTGYYQNYFGYGLLMAIVFYFILYKCMFRNLMQIKDIKIKIPMYFLFAIIAFGEAKEPYIHHFGNVFVFFMICFLAQKDQYIYETNY